MIRLILNTRMGIINVHTRRYPETAKSESR
jgi:hypothetical protein